MKAKGFTLVELLVVVAIIALLISILMPSLNQAREMAKRAVCAANMKALMTASQMYANDHNDHYMVGDGRWPAMMNEVCFRTDFGGDGGGPGGWSLASWRRFGTVGRFPISGNDTVVMPGLYCWRSLGLLARVGESPRGRPSTQFPEKETNYAPPRSMFCPSEKPEYHSWYTTGDWTKRYYEDSKGVWSLAAEVRHPVRYISYLQNTMTKENWGSYGESTIDGVSGAPTSEEMLGKALASDMFSLGDADHETGYNVGMADGSAHWFSDPNSMDSKTRLITVGSVKLYRNGGVWGMPEDCGESWRRLATMDTSKRDEHD